MDVEPESIEVLLETLLLPIVFVVTVIAVVNEPTVLLLSVRRSATVELVSSISEEATPEESLLARAALEELLFEEMALKAAVLEDKGLLLEISTVVIAMLVELTFGGDRLLEKDTMESSPEVKVLNKMVFEEAALEDMTLEDATAGDEAVKDMLLLASRVDVRELKSVLGKELPGVVETSLGLLSVLPGCAVLGDRLDTFEKLLKNAVLEDSPSVVACVELPESRLESLLPGFVVLGPDNSVVRVDLSGLVMVLVSSA